MADAARPGRDRTLAELLRVHAGSVRQVAFIDLHTGLGPYGVGEIINNHSAGERAFARVSQWFGGEATSTDAGSSSSAPVSGDITLGVERALPQAEITGVTLEYGTLPLKDVLDAVRADNWLHAHGDLRARQARDIKAQIRSAFYPEADDWKSMVFERSVDVLGGGPPPASPNPRDHGRLARPAQQGRRRGAIPARRW